MFGDAEDFKAIQEADDFVAMRLDARLIPLVGVKWRVGSRQHGALAAVLFPETEFVLARGGGVHADGESVEVGLGGVWGRQFGVGVSGGWRRFIAVIEDDAGLAVFQLQGAGQVVVVKIVIAGGDDGVLALAAAFEGVEIR